MSEPFYQIYSEGEGGEENSATLVVGEAKESPSNSSSDDYAVDIAGLVSSSGDTVTITEMSEKEYRDE